jgi:hypothetical protein
LLGVLQAPAHAQAELPFPELAPFERVSAPLSEYFDGVEPQSILFGWTVASNRDTLLIQEAGYPRTNAMVGRIAVFTRDDMGAWARKGSIDPQNAPSFDSDPFHTFGNPLAIFDDVALIGSSQGMSVYHRKGGDWKRVQQLRLKAGWFFTDVALNRKFAFLATSLNGQGVVYAYRVKSNGRLEYLQRLDSGVDFDFYAEHLALSDNRLVVSAIGDHDDRGAAYVFERRGARWIKQQKLVAANATPGTLFSSAVAISGDWISVGASGFPAKGGEGCPGGHNRGALYVFHQVNGRWQQQQFVPADQLAGTASCVASLGHDIVMSGKWLVASAAAFFVGDRDLDVPVIYRQEHGQYIPSARAGIAQQAALALNGNTLVVGEAAGFGCTSTACVGMAGIYNLEQIP